MVTARENPGSRPRRRAMTGVSAWGARDVRARDGSRWDLLKNGRRGDGGIRPRDDVDLAHATGALAAEACSEDLLATGNFPCSCPRCRELSSSVWGSRSLREMVHLRCGPLTRSLILQDAGSLVGAGDTSSTSTPTRGDHRRATTARLPGTLSICTSTKACSSCSLRRRRGPCKRRPRW